MARIPGRARRGNARVVTCGASARGRSFEPDGVRWTYPYSMQSILPWLVAELDDCPLVARSAPDTDRTVLWLCDLSATDRLFFIALLCFLFPPSRSPALSYSIHLYHICIFHSLRCISIYFSRPRFAPAGHALFFIFLITVHTETQARKYSNPLLLRHCKGTLTFKSLV